MLYKIGPRGDPFNTPTVFSSVISAGNALSLQSESFNCVELHHDS